MSAGVTFGPTTPSADAYASIQIAQAIRMHAEAVEKLAKAFQLIAQAMERR